MIKPRAVLHFLFTLCFILLHLCIFRRTLTPFPPPPTRLLGTNPWSLGINTSLPGTRALHFGLVDCVATPAPRQLSSDRLTEPHFVYPTYSRFRRWKSSTLKKKLSASGIDPHSPQPNSDSRTIRPSGRDCAYHVVIACHLREGAVRYFSM